MDDGGTDQRSVWLIRAGKQGETERTCFEQKLCGIGWPELPNLEGHGLEEIEREIDIAYFDRPQGEISNSKMQLRHFMAIKPRDFVLMPLKGDNKDQVAIGEVTGPYEYRTDLPPLARHVKATTWLSAGEPRDLVKAIGGSLNRPVTVGSVKATAAEVDRLLQAGQPLVGQLTDDERVLASVFDRILAAMATQGQDADLSQLLQTAGPKAIAALLGDGYPTKSGEGQGRPAKVPWLAIAPPGQTFSPRQDYYLVYLFAADGSAAYLSLNQGTEALRGGKAPLEKRAADLRAAADLQTGAEIDLRAENKRPAKYQAGNAYAYAYQAGSIPNDAELLEDLTALLAGLARAQESGLAFDPEIEPLHLIFKWSADIEPQTIDLHRAVAEKNGSTWWGKFGESPSPISKKKLRFLEEQLAAGIPTYAYLYGGGTTVRTVLMEVQVDGKKVDAERLPNYYTHADCNLFVRLADFEEMPADWLAIHVVLASNPTPTKTAGALSNQTTPIFVYERHLRAPVAEPTKEEVDIKWLVGKTLWAESDLTELIDALNDKGQVILAGPPGTGKTWVADHLARYLTGDEPLRHRTVQFHPSYGYEEFVEGLRPVATDGAISFQRTNGVILDIAEKIEDSDDLHILIIDELNRANIPRVFGELLYLLEYREQAIDLQFSRDFSLPANLKIIATMNTADRSTRSIDVALRRRFEIFECPADPLVLSRYFDSRTSEVKDLVKGFTKLNDELSTQIDRHHTIGHSFFMRDGLTASDLARIWSRQIGPLLEDYFFDQEELLEEFVKEKYWPEADNSH